MTPFGCRLSNPKPEIDGLDMSQLYLFLQLGLIPFIIVSVLWIMLLYHQVKNNRIQELIVTITLLVMGITDPFLYNLSYKNLAFVFMGTLIYHCCAFDRYTILNMLQRKIRFIQIGSKLVNIPGIVIIPKAQKQLRTVIIQLVGIILFATIAVVYYKTTPEPKIIISDREVGERGCNYQFYNRVYTKSEITTLKKEGVLVLNYTDETEPMFTYYTDESNPVEGGFYVPMAGKVEIFRKSVSIFAWPLFLWFLLVFIHRIKRLIVSYDSGNCLSSFNNT